MAPESLQKAKERLEAPGTRVVLGLLLVGLLAGGAATAWSVWGHLIGARDDYRLSADSIEITTPPPWISADVKAEVVRDGALEGANILDPKITIKVARAFSVHNWVEHVERVRKHHPARVVVDLRYRRPVAMVEVVMNDSRGLLPVDVGGVLLPPEDFSPNQARDYLRIAVGDSAPAGPVGTPWGDERVVGAARIAATLREVWRRLDLYRIAAPGVGQRSERAGEYRLMTRRGTTILWGRPPGEEGSEEASPREKIMQMIAYIQQHGSLDAGDGLLDLRHPQQALIPQREGESSGERR